MAEYGLEDNKTYDLKLGSSFRSRKENAFHTVRYDFKPASVDTSKPSELMVGKSNDITVVLPHVQESGSTTYKGSKRPCGKECILIIDKATGAVTLERINSNIQLKKIRSSSGSASLNKPVNPSPISVPKLPSKNNNGKAKSTKQPASEQQTTKSVAEPIKSTTINAKPVSQLFVNGTLDVTCFRFPVILRRKPLVSLVVLKHIPSKEITTIAPDLKESGSDSSSSDSDSDSDSDADDGELQEQGEALESTLNLMVAEDKAQPFTSSLREDLLLTESESDSD